MKASHKHSQVARFWRVKIPPGPRLKILNYVEASKKHMAAYAQQPAAYAAPAQDAGQGLTHA